MLKACLHGFNCIPNTRLDIEDVKNTYVLASKIELLLKEGKLVYALNLCLQQYAEPQIINSKSDLLQFMDDVEEFNKSMNE